MYRYVKSDLEFGRNNPKWLYEGLYYLDDEYDSDNSDWEEVDSKSVRDSDGFYTDYTMYFNPETGEYVFVFGDKDLYRPEDGNWDWGPVENEDEAWEWFNDYTGFEDEEDI